MAQRRDFEMPDPPIRLSQIPASVITFFLTVILVVLGWALFSGLFRVNIGPNEVGIVTNKFGNDTGEKFAYSWDDKGTMVETLPPGNYFLNSLLRDVKVVEVVEVPAGQAMVLVAKYGASPRAGKIMAEEDELDADGRIKKPGQKGPRPRVYGPGKYRINTDAFDCQVFDATLITTTGPAAQTAVERAYRDTARTSRRRGRRPAPVKEAVAVPASQRSAAPEVAFSHNLGVVTSKVGAPLRPGQLLAEENQKGIKKRIMGPGMYYVHPRMMTVTPVKAVDIPAGYVGVVTQYVGEPLPPDQPLATRPDQQGIAADVLGPGTYYLNPHAKKVDRIDARYQKFSMEEAEGIKFPSTDSFTIEVDLAFEWRYTPGEIPKTFDTLGDSENVINNLLIQQARSIGRIEGSRYAGRDFIEGEPRQAFQDNFATTFAASCKEKGITIPRVAVKRIVPPTQIAERMRNAVVAQETLLANKEKEQTARVEALYEEAKTNIEFVEKQVEAETELKVQEIEAEAAKERGLIEVETEKQVAALELQAAEIEAQITELLGQAEADGDRYMRKAKADGLKLLVDAFQQASAYVSYKFAEAFTPDTRLIMSEDSFLEFLGGLSGAMAAPR